jgi:hypothetical protein
LGHYGLRFLVGCVGGGWGWVGGGLFLICVAYGAACLAFFSARRLGLLAKERLAQLAALGARVQGGRKAAWTPVGVARAG